MIKQAPQTETSLQALKMRISSMLSGEAFKGEEEVPEEEWADFNPCFKIYSDFKDNKEHSNNKLGQSMSDWI